MYFDDGKGESYLQLAKLGGGKYASVKKVCRRTDNKFFALKLEDSSDPSRKQEARKSMEEEIGLYQRASHPALAAYEASTKSSDGSLMLFMEYIDGATLESTLSAKLSLEPAQALRLAREVADLLFYLDSKKLMHPHLEDSDIILQKENGAAKVVDFGMPYLSQHSQGTYSVHGILGPVVYSLPPEFLSVRKEGAISANVYSLAAILVRCISGAKIFSANVETVRAMKILNETPDLKQLGLSSKVSPGFENMIARALRKKPEERPAIAEFLEALRAESRRSL